MTTGLLISEVSESCSVVSDSLWPLGLHSPWNSPGQNTGVGSLSLLQGIFPTQRWNPGLPHCRQIPYQLSQDTGVGSLPFSSGSSQPRDWTQGSPGDIPNPGIKPRSPTLEAGSLPAEPQGKPSILIDKINLISFQKNRHETQSGPGTLERLVASCLVL